MTTRPQPAPPKPGIARPKTVAILESSAKMGGIQHTTLALAANIDRQLWNPVLICPEEGELTRACRAAGVEVRLLPAPRLYSTSVWIDNRTKIPNPAAWIWNTAVIAGASRRLAGYLRELAPDVVITKGLLCHFYGGLAARRAGVPCLWYVQDFISERFGGIYTKVFGAVAARVPTQVAAIGPQIVRQLPLAMQARSQVVFNPVDTPPVADPGSRGTIRAELGLPSDAVVIGNAARLTPWKGQHFLIEAFRQVAAVEPKARLVLMGGSLFGEEDYARRLRNLVQEAGLDGRVLFTGHRGDVKRLLGALDVFAYCATEKDICPLSLLEAMSTALPIAAFEIEGVKLAIQNGSEGLLAPVGDSSALAQAMLSLLGSSPLRQRLGQAAKQRAEADFSVARHVRGMERACELTLAVANA